MAGDVDDLSEFEALIATLGIEVTPRQIQQLWQYAQLLWEANRQVNLTRHTTSRVFVQRDLLDSVQLSRQVAAGSRVLDIGSGGGVPGIPLSVLRPDLRVSLCESTGKKAKLLARFVQTLELPVPVYAARAEEVLGAPKGNRDRPGRPHALPDGRGSHENSPRKPTANLLPRGQAFDVCLARAVGPLWKLCTVLKPHWHSVGRLLAVKGPNWRQEQSEARDRNLLRHLQISVLAQYEVAETGARSFVLELVPLMQKTRRRKNNPSKT